MYEFLKQFILKFRVRKKKLYADITEVWVFKMGKSFIFVFSKYGDLYNTIKLYIPKSYSRNYVFLCFLPQSPVQWKADQKLQVFPSHQYLQKHCDFLHVKRTMITKIEETKMEITALKSEIVLLKSNIVHSENILLTNLV